MNFAPEAEIDLSPVPMLCFSRVKGATMVKRFRAFLEAEKQRNIFFWYDSNDTTAAAAAASILEEGKTYDFKKGYTGRADKAVQPNQQDHIHVELKGNQVAVLNLDGTPSHGSDLSKIPRHVWKQLTKLGYKKLEESTLLIESAEEAAAHAKALAESMSGFEMWIRLWPPSAG